jgi:ribosome biogenesis ATPase
LDKLLYVPLPTPADRVSILKALAGGINLSPEVDLNLIGASSRAEGYSGADCAALLREAGLAVLKEDVGTGVDFSSLCIAPRHFDYAFAHVIPSVSHKDQARYNRMRDRMAHARSRGAVVAEATANDGDDPVGTVDNKEESRPADATRNSAVVPNGKGDIKIENPAENISTC